MNNWEHFSHDADIGIRGYGDTLAEAFSQAALAVTALITDPATVSPQTAIHVECQAEAPDILFLDWINEMVFFMSTRQMLFSQFEVKIKGDTLIATLWGENIDRQKHQPSVEVKGATMTELNVTQHNGQWLAQTVVDV